MIRGCGTRKRKKKTAELVCGKHLPEDLLIECIFPRLSLPCLFRCASVCKTWRRLVHETHALYGGTTMTKYALFLSSSPLVNGRFMSNTRVLAPSSDEAPVDIFRQYSPEWRICDATNGFFLCCSIDKIRGRRRGFSARLRVCNPITYKSVPLPHMSLVRCSPFFYFRMLIFDPAVSHHYKVLAFYGRRHEVDDDQERKVYEKVCVFSSHQPHLGWHPLDSHVPQLLNRELPGSIEESIRTVCLNGYAYRLGYRTVDDFYSFFNNVVLKIDAKDLRFEFIESPPALDAPAVMMDSVWSRLDKAQDCLHYIYNYRRNVRIWRLRECGRSWALMHTICFSDDLTCYPKDSCLLAFNGNDQILLFFDDDEFLRQYDMKRHLLRYYLDRDGKPVSGTVLALSTFIYCAIYPEYRRIVLRPPK